MKRYEFGAILISVIFILFPVVLSAVCTPEAQWEVDCNICLCMKNGVEACTNKSCDIHETRLSIPECRPGAIWKEDCNTCFCTGKGWAACTRMGCERKTNVALEDMEKVKLTFHERVATNADTIEVGGYDALK